MGWPPVVDLSQSKLSLIRAHGGLLIVGAKRVSASIADRMDLAAVVKLVVEEIHRPYVVWSFGAVRRSRSWL